VVGDVRRVLEGYFGSLPRGSSGYNRSMELVKEWENAKKRELSGGDETVTAEKGERATSGLVSPPGSPLSDLSGKGSVEDSSASATQRTDYGRPAQ